MRRQKNKQHNKPENKVNPLSFGECVCVCDRGSKPKTTETFSKHPKGSAEMSQRVNQPEKLSKATGAVGGGTANEYSLKLRT